MGLTRKDLEGWEGELVARVDKFKRSIERQRGGLNRRGVKQRKQDGHLEKAKQQGAARGDKPSRRSGGGGARKIQGEQQIKAWISDLPPKPR